MNPRIENPQDIFARKLLVLMPSAKFSVRPYDNNSHEAANPILRGKFLIDWHKDNVGECPAFDEVDAVQDSQVKEAENNQRKKSRDMDKAADLTVVSNFEMEKKSNPDIKFSDYLDNLETKSQEILDSMKDHV